jgi:hypothetical protein
VPKSGICRGSGRRRRRLPRRRLESRCLICTSFVDLMSAVVGLGAVYWTANSNDTLYVLDCMYANSHAI